MSVRLFILGSLIKHGPLHGYQIRRNAEQEHIDRWASVTVGSLYGAIKRMTAEGSIAVHSTERAGNLPSRTVYQVTDQGQAEFETLRRETLEDLHIANDPIDLALHFSSDISPLELRRVIDDRCDTISAELDSWRDLIEFATPHLKRLEPIVVKHRLRRLEAELAWHEEVRSFIDAMIATEGETDAP